MKVKEIVNEECFTPVVFRIKIETMSELESLVARLNISSESINNISGDYKCHERPSELSSLLESKLINLKMDENYDTSI